MLPGGYVKLSNVTWSFADIAIPAAPGAWLAESVKAGSVITEPIPASGATIILHKNVTAIDGPPVLPVATNRCAADIGGSVAAQV